MIPYELRKLEQRRAQKPTRWWGYIVFGLSLVLWAVILTGAERLFG